MTCAQSFGDYADERGMVMRLENIQQYIEQGEFPQAYGALDELLSLGPKNTNALRMKAILYSYEGRFREEARVWRKILTIDPEDEWAINYFQRAMQEEREHEYFTDLLPTGAIRFLTTPRAIVNTSFFGLMGCAVFLTVANFSHHFPFLAKPSVSFSFFVGLVIVPWLLILYAYFKSVKEIVIDRDAIHVRTRTKDFDLEWSGVETFCLAHRVPPNDAGLSIILIPKDPNLAPFEINIGQNSFVRAPSFLVREITRVFREPSYETWANLKLAKKPLIFT